MNSEFEKTYPLSVKIKQEQEQFIAVIKKDSLEDSNNHEISTAINESLDLNVDGLISIADQVVTQNEDITKDQLIYALLQSISSTNKNKQIRKIAKKLLKKVGK
jgi:hypothetical protein